MRVKKLIIFLLLATNLGTASFSQACYTDDEIPYTYQEEQEDSYNELVSWVGLLFGFWLN